MVINLFCTYPGAPVWSLKTQADEKHSTCNCRFCIPSNFFYFCYFKFGGTTEHKCFMSKQYTGSKP